VVVEIANAVTSLACFLGRLINRRRAA